MRPGTHLHWVVRGSRWFTIDSCTLPLNGTTTPWNWINAWSCARGGRHSSGLDKLEIYHRLGIREVWFWIRERLTVHVRRGHGYVEAARSSVLRGIDVKQLAHFARHESPARAPLLYRAALRRTSSEG